MHKIADLRFINFPIFGGEEASLTVYARPDNVPFEVERIFTINAKETCKRGFHAHKECSQLMIVLTGECTVICDDGSERKEVILCADSKGLLIPPTIWAEQEYKEGTTLMVLADKPYNETEYLRDYDAFIKFRKTCEGRL